MLRNQYDTAELQRWNIKRNINGKVRNWVSSLHKTSLEGDVWHCVILLHRWELLSKCRNLRRILERSAHVPGARCGHHSYPGGNKWPTSVTVHSTFQANLRPTPQQMQGLILYCTCFWYETIWKENDTQNPESREGNQRHMHRPGLPANTHQVHCLISKEILTFSEK